jgi:hypothetical protein
LNSTPGFWLRVKDRVTFGLATQEVLDRLARIGIVIYPYFLVYEPILARPEVDMLNRNLRLKLLDTHEASLVASVAERPRDESKVREAMTRASCIAVMKDEELLGYSWFGRQGLRGPVSANSLCELPPEWAYLFDMYVRPKARGRKLAVYMRHGVQQMLIEKGVAHCCSVTLAFNRSSRRFKAKLGAIEPELRLLLRLGSRAGLDLRLRRKPWPLQTPALHIAQPSERSIL